MNIMHINTCIRNKEVSPVDVVKETLKNIYEKNPDNNSFITISEQDALKSAKILEEELMTGHIRGPLHGIPIAIKDLIYTKGIKTTMGSKIYEHFIPAFDATVVEKLKQAGAIIIGKANTHEFAYGPVGDRSYFGACRNPHNLKKISGGSSSGSAAAVAANMVLASIGTDTGGSIRIPSSACGVVGMKPTFGLVSKAGSFPLAYTLDHIGPITSNIKDNALLLNIIAGYDPKDDFSLHTEENKDYSRLIGEDVKDKKIGIATNSYFTKVNQEIKDAFDRCVHVFERLQTNVSEVSVPSIEEIADAQAITIKAEAAAVHADSLESYQGQIDEEVYDRLIASKQVSGYEYVQAQMNRNKLISKFNQLFDDVDILLVPTLPILPTNIDQREVTIDHTPVTTQYALLKLTSPFNYSGNPALSVPCGMSESGLPIGVQLIGRHGDEETLYQFGYALESELNK